MKDTYTCQAAGFEPFFIKDLLKKNSQIILLAPSALKAERLYNQLQFLKLDTPVYNLPAWDCLPYDRISPSLDIMTSRIEVLTKISKTPDAPCVLVVPVRSFFQKVAPVEVYKNTCLKVQKDTPQLYNVLQSYLKQYHYTRTETVYDWGEYAIRGGIFDIFPAGEEKPIRLDFFDQELESCFSFDPLTQRRLEEKDSFTLRPTREVLLTSNTIESFKKSYRILSKGETNDPFYEAISLGRVYAGMEHWLPLFYENLVGVFDYLSNPVVVYNPYCDLAGQELAENIKDYYNARLNPFLGDRNLTYHPIDPSALFFEQDLLKDLNTIELSPYEGTGASPTLPAPFSAIPAAGISSSHKDSYLPRNDNGKSENDNGRLGIYTKIDAKPYDSLKSLISQGITVVLEKFSYEIEDNRKTKVCFIGCSSKGSYERLCTILSEHALAHPTWVESFPKKAGFYAGEMILDTGFVTRDLFVISEQDLLGERFINKRSSKKTQNSFFDTTSLAVGDYVVHEDHGIGRYEGLETVIVENTAHDCLLLTYEEGDKLFIPVENLDLISRYGSKEGMVALDRLGTAQWQQRKAKARKKIKEVAQYLMKVAAQRSLKEAFIAEPCHDFDEFCAQFPYAETDDQLSSIESVLKDLKSGRPMDRLVCGDVGFGKTEVAIRAAYVVAATGKQVVIVVPTTLLCRQHFHNFEKRFHNTPFKVAQLSRLVSDSKAKKIYDQMEKGEISILVSTHAVFSKNLSFENLGLLIVDEEQHFGVKQKEKLKALKGDIHVLTLTATPIPRTLQLALTGVRELSLITTPPVDKLAVRTFVMPYDPVVLKEAILREHLRGGQVFFVCPRLDHIKEIQEKLVKWVPDLKVAVAHGKLPVKELEDVMTGFYDRQFDILLSTNIIESGIDIANANTLIIHRPDLFGLSQLYQLRGRVGRGKVQAYAYFVLPNEQQTKITPTALKRLEVMQSLDHLGAGFTLASHDLDIRGAGNIVGEEQSGHIREVGVELYQTMLQEAVIQLRIEEETQNPLEEGSWSPQLNLGTAVLIPETYVRDLNVRLDLYKRASSFTTSEELDLFAIELVDRFGSLPKEVLNFIQTLEIKQLCKKAHIEKLDVGPKGVVIAFKDNTFPNPAGLIQYLQKIKAAKIRPDQKIVFLYEWVSVEQRSLAVMSLCKNLAGLCKEK
ncbi:MAG TPA: transcription-repair coupling factor [Alphaproteobacteria bacterium]|nr:transcription-repair coupling factor [Alphaproteobacteria bacterium]